MDLSIGDPWLLLTAFGFVGSAGLLVYLVRQLNAASEDDEGPELETAAAAAEPAPMPVAKAEPPAPAPKPAMAAPRTEVKMPDSELLTDVMGPPKRAAAPAPEVAPAAARSPSEISPAVAFIKALHEDIQTFHWEIQGIKKKLDNFEQNQHKQMELLTEKLQSLERQSLSPKSPPESGPPPTPFQ